MGISHFLEIFTLTICTLMQHANAVLKKSKLIYKNMDWTS